MDGNLDTLRQRQAAPLEAKVQLAKTRIREWADHWDGDVYVSYSGGKDSTVLLHLARQVLPDVPAVFVDTGLEFPELRRVAIHTPSVVVVRPAMPFKAVLDRYGYPVISKQVARQVSDVQRASARNAATVNLRLTGYNRAGQLCQAQMIPARWRFLVGAPFKVSDYCCDVLKKHPLDAYARETGRKPMTGMRAEESGRRAKLYNRTGCNVYDAKKPTSSPLAVWTEQDVLAYIDAHRLPLPEVYGDVVRDASGYRCTGEQRTGCIFCLFGIHYHPDRFDRLRRTHPKQHAHCMDVLGIGRVLDYLSKHGALSRQLDLCA